MPKAFLHKNKPLALIASLSIVLLFRLGNLFEPVAESSGAGILYPFLRVEVWPAFVQVLVSVALLVISAIIFDLILTRFNILGSISGYPLFFFAVFASLHPAMGSMSPAVLALPFIGAACWALLINYSEKRGQFTALWSGLFLAFAALFYAPFILLFPFGIVALATLKPASGREFIAQSMGFLLPFGFAYAVFYLSDYHGARWPLPGYVDLPNFFDAFSSDWDIWMVTVLVFGLLNFALFISFNQMSTYKILVRRFFVALIMLPAFLVLAFMMSPLPNVGAFWPVVFPFSLLLSRLFIDFRSKAFLRLLLGLVLLVALLAHFNYYFGSDFTFKLVN